MTDRVDYLAGIFCNTAHCLAVERLMEIEVPKRAQYLRVLAMEINRIASHLIFFGIFSLDLGAVTPMPWTFRDREWAIDLLERMTGQRLTFNYTRFGGVSLDLPEKDFLNKVEWFLEDFPKRLKDYERVLFANPILLARTKDIGTVPAEMAINYGLSGPNTRSSGVDFDLRRDIPYDAYKDFDFDVITLENGDSYDRFIARYYEMIESMKIIRQCIDGLPEGEINSLKMAKQSRIKPPEGEVYVRVESPRGDYGVYLQSDGSEKPYRLKLRTPSFNNLSIVCKLIEGVYLADIVPIFGSLDVILPDVDR
jgi:NADH-quinone oxidoreductase subunit D